MTESALIQAWRQALENHAQGFSLVDANHPLQFYIGVTESGHPRVVVRSYSKPRSLTLSEVVLVERFEDEGGMWNLSFIVQDQNFDEVFLRLIDDLHTRTAECQNESSALDRLNLVLDQWRRLLKPRPSGVLSMEELRGLVGELWLLTHAFNSSRPIAAAISGWLGPMGLPQDFWYPDSGYYEAKSIGPATTRIKISSEQQLDTNELELLILLVGNTPESAPGAINLPTLVARVLEALAETAESPKEFNDRLARLGVDPAATFYHDTWFVVSRLTSYKVGPSFPAIRATLIPSGVERVTYQIDLSSVDEFKLYVTEVT
jgi:hypothetical protein